MNQSTSYSFKSGLNMYQGGPDHQTEIQLDDANLKKLLEYVKNCSNTLQLFEYFKNYWNT